MTELSLHSSGKKDHLKSLKKDIKTTNKEKRGIKSLKKIFKVEKRNADHNLY